MIISHSLLFNTLHMWYYNRKGKLMVWSEVHGTRESIHNSLSEVRYYYDSNDYLIHDDGDL